MLGVCRVFAPKTGRSLPALLQGISAIGVELKKERIKAEQARHQQDAAIAILDVRSVHDGMHQEALRVDENVALLTLDLLARIIAMRVDTRPLFQRFSRSGYR
jgi:hypothetical protein